MWHVYIAYIHSLSWCKQKKWKSLLECFKKHNLPRHRFTCRDGVREGFEQEKMLSAS